jgi:regulator of protease activity HflC (stomatin/prohibitin superfamily)
MRFVIIALVVFLVALVAGSLIRIGPDEIGVRSDNFGFSGRGIVQRDFGPGWHLNLPVVHTWTVFPGRVRRMELTKDPRHRSPIGRDALLVQSNDGDRVMLDVALYYRITPGRAHRLLQDSGAADAHVPILESLTRDSLRAAFGKLGTEQFYDPAMRHDGTAKALVALREALAPRHLEMVEIMIEDIEFDPKYEQKIKDKKLNDQKVELSKAQARAAAEGAKVAAIRITTERQVKLIKTEATAEAAAIRAEAEKAASARRAETDLYRQRHVAKGILARTAAEADVKRAKTRALVGSGGANLAALEAVKRLKIDSITFPTAGRDWFDVREMASRLGARER